MNFGHYADEMFSNSDFYTSLELCFICAMLRSSVQLSKKWKEHAEERWQAGELELSVIVGKAAVLGGLVL